VREFAPLRPLRPSCGRLLAEAHARAEGIARETERVLRDHAERREEVQTHMDHVRASLSALTGRVVD
jgi:hypothetical protein